jgi:5-methylcytosine-specific restriction endonuclease McrA
MQINHIHRPWQKNSNYGNRTTADPYYQSRSWKNNRASFRKGFTIVNGVQLLNIYCVECYKQHGRLVKGSNTDHIIRRKDGGSDEHNNLQTLCDSHHNRKSANEGNESRKPK